MNIDAIIKSLLRKIGIDIRKNIVSRSDAARLLKLFQHYSVDSILDIGANVGQYARYLRAIGYRGKITCFEPLESAHLKLQNFARHDRNIVIAPRMALGDHEGEIIINVSENSLSSSILPMLETHTQIAPGSSYVSSEVVRLGRLDALDSSYLSDSKGVFLKIDAQGYESQVIEGATGVLPQIKGIQLEMSLVPLYAGEPLYREMINKIESLGYTLHDINPSFADSKTGRTYQVDGIFFRN